MFLKIPVYLHNLINNALGTFFISLTKNIHTYPPPWMVNGDSIGEGFSKSEALSGYKKILIPPLCMVSGDSFGKGLTGSLNQKFYHVIKKYPYHPSPMDGQWRFCGGRGSLKFHGRGEPEGPVQTKLSEERQRFSGISECF